MNFYQAGYFRQGMQGGNAGWGIVSPSKGMSQTAKDGFKGISANLVELKNTAAMPTVNFGIFQHDRFIYILHVNYAASGEDSRGVVFVHGYCINNADYYELCMKPEMLFGIREENFLMEYDASQEQYPVRNALTHDALSYTELCEKYHLTKSEYRALILRAINALEGYADPLCIRMDRAQEDYLQASRELGYLIMMGLPYHMRSKLSFFSYAGARAAVYVCGRAEGNNCVDLDAREFEGADVSRLLYEFTKIYNTFDLGAYEVREKIFNGIASAINDMYQKPLQEVSCSQIEAGFQAYLKKTDEVSISDVKGICAENVLELLYSFLRSELKENEEVYAYLAALLEVVNDSALRIGEKRIVQHLSDGFNRTSNAAYRREVCRMMAGELLAGDREKGFAELNRLSVESGEQFALIGEELNKRDSGFVDAYRKDSYLPFTLTDIDKVAAYVEKEQRRVSMDEYRTILAILLDVAPKTMKETNSFSQQYQIVTEVDRLLSEGFPSEMRQDTAQVMRKIRYLFWEQFDISGFSTSEIEKYRKMKPEEAATDRWGNKGSKNAEKVSGLLQLIDGRKESGSSRLLREILFTNAVFEDAGQKRQLQQFLLNNSQSSFHVDDIAGQGSEFDWWLALFYDFDSNRFSTIQWGRKFSEYVGNALESSYVVKAIEKSDLMKQETIRRAFLESLSSDIRSAKREGEKPSVVKGLKRYERCVSGKKLKDDNDLDAQRRFADTLCRIPVGSLALLAIGALLSTAVRLDTSDFLDRFVLLMTGGIFLILIVAAIAIKAVYMREDFLVLKEDAGIVNTPQLTGYLLAAVFSLTAVVVTLIFNQLRVTVIVAGICLAVAVVGMVAAGILTRDSD